MTLGNSSATRQGLNLCAGDLRGRRTVQRFRPLTRLVQHLRVQGANRARVGLDAGRVHGRGRRGVETGLDQRRAGEHQQLREVLRLDLGVRHAGKELHLSRHHHAADVAGRARKEHAIHRARAPEARPIAFPVLLRVGGSQLGEQQTRVLKDAPRQQPPVVDRRLGRRQRLERARVLERESERKRRLAFACRARDAVDVVGRVGSDADVIEGPPAGGAPDPAGTIASRFQIRAMARSVGFCMVGIEIENRLEEHERHAVESDGVVAEPAPGQAGILAAAEAVLLGAARIGVVQISVDGPLAFRDLRRPVGHDLPIDPRHDVLARVVLQRRHEPCARPFPPRPRTRGSRSQGHGRTRTPRQQSERCTASLRFLQIDMQSPRCQLPAVEGQKRRVVPESANRRENVVV